MSRCGEPLSGRDAPCHRAPAGRQLPHCSQALPSPSERDNGLIIDPKCIGRDTEGRATAQSPPPRLAGIVSSSTANGVESSICHRHGLMALLLLTSPCKEAGGGQLSQPLFQPRALGALKSTSWGIRQLGNPSGRPGRAHALFPAKEKPCFQAQLQRQVNPGGLLWLRNPVRSHTPARAPVLRYLGGITTIGWPRLGLHMRTWASLALGFTSAFGGMGSILLRIRGCSC